MNNFAQPYQVVPLSSFLGLYTEASSESLPEGMSPLNWDCDFIIGSVRMRPGLESAFTFGGNTSGPNNCTSGTNVSLGNIPWVNPGNIVSANTQYAVFSGVSVSSQTNAPTAASQSGTGAAWSNVSNIFATGASYATVSLSSTTTGVVSSVHVTNGGRNYGSAPTVSFSGGGGSGAAAYAVMTYSDGLGYYFVSSVVVTNGGSGYTSAPTVTFTGGGGVGAAAFANISSTGSSPTSEVINCTAEGFTIPSGATINSVTIHLNGSATAATTAYAQLIVSGSATGSIYGTSVPGATAPFTVSGSDPLWGATLTPAIVNASNFGVQIYVNSSLTSSVSLNSATIAVGYTISGPASDELLASVFGFALANLPVQGITIGITGYQMGTGTVTAQLVKNGVLVGQTRSLTLGASNTRMPLGSGTDNWGASLLYSDINNTAFGVAITVAGTGTTYIDLVDCTITQTSGSQNFNWIKTYTQRSTQVSTLALDATGTLWDENVTSTPGVLNSIYTDMLPNQFAKSVTLDDVEYIALSNLQAGQDMPRQWFGPNAYLDRVSQVGPGAAPVVNFTTNQVSLTALTQPASFTVPAGPNTWIVWSTGPSAVNKAPGNILTFAFPSSFTLPAGFVNGAYVAIASMPALNGFNPNSGATNAGITNPAAYQIFNVGGSIQGQTYYDGFSVLLLQTGFANVTVTGTSLQLTLATATASSQVPNIQVGSQFIISGMTPTGWNGTWTCLYTPNAGQYLITNSALTSNVATFSYTLVTGANPTAGETIIVTGCVNGNGIFNGTFVVATATGSQFTATLTSPNVSSAPENGQAIVNGSVFQFDPQKVVGNGTVFGAITTTGAIGAGARACVVMFLTRNGLITAPSPYVQFSTTGGANSLVVSNIPLGPSNVIARVIAFTAAQVTQIPGQIGNFFWIPEPVTVFDPTAGQDVTYSATIIHDNTSTQATFTFTDAVLLASQGIDIQGNNLFNQQELGPSIGCISAFGRMFWWGTLNKVPNFINMSFDGGAGVNSASGGISSGGSATYPLGWTPSDTYGSVINNAVFGTSYYIRQTGSTTPIGMITQGAYQDQYGMNILNPQTAYSVRLSVRTPASSTVGNLVVDLYSPSFNRVYGTATFPLSGMTSSFQILTSTLLTNVFSVAVVSDLQIRIYATGLTNGEDVEVDRLEVYPTQQPVLTTQVQASYINNFEAFDQVTGVIEAAVQNQQPVRAAFTLFDTLYIVKSGSFVATQDNGTTEPFKWSLRTVSNSVGTPSVNGVDFVDSQNQGESYALIASRQGVYAFNGGEPVLITNGIRSLWQAINWTYGHTLWIRNDPANRRILVGVPLPTPNQWLPNAPVNASPTTPNVMLAMSYAELNSVSQLIDHQEIRTSFTGKLIAPEIARKWSIWQIQAPYADFITRQNNTSPLFFGNSKSTGKCYQLTEGLANDDGAAINQTYTTYGWVKPDMAEQIQLGLGRYFYAYLSMKIVGSGTLTMKTYPDSLDSTYAATLPTLAIAAPGAPDTEVPLQEVGSRMFLQFSVNAVGDNFNLSQIRMAIGRDAYAPVRGT